MHLPKKARIAHRRGYLTPPVIIVLAIIVLFVATSLYLNAKIFSKPEASPQPTTQTSSTPTSGQSAINDTANWKTYTGKKLGFTIKYPSEIAIREVLPDGGVEFGKAKDLQKDRLSVNSLSIYKRSGAGGDPETALRDSDCPKPCSEETEKTFINNAVGIKTLGPGYPYEHNYYLVDKNKTKNVIRLSFIPNPADPDSNTDSFEKMITTFQFID